MSHFEQSPDISEMSVEMREKLSFVPLLSVNRSSTLGERLGCDEVVLLQNLFEDYYII